MRRIKYVFLLALIFAIPGNSFAENDNFYTLRELVSLGLNKSYTILQSEEDIAISEAQKKQSFSLFIPDIDLSAGTLDYHDDTDLADFIYDKYSWGITLKQPLFAGGRIFRTYQNAKMNLNISSDFFEKTRQDIAFEIIRYYYNALQAEDNLIVAEESLRQVKEQKKIAEANVNAGISVKNELLRVEVREAGIISALISSKAEVKKSRERLQFILGTRLPEEFVLEKVAEDAEPIHKVYTVDILLGRADDARIDLRILKTQMKILDNNIRIARSDYIPNLNFMASQTKGGPDFPPEDKVWMVGAEITWPIFDGGLRKGKVDEAKAQLEKIKKTYDELTSWVRLEISIALLDLESSYNNIGVRRKGIEQAEENLKLTELQFKEGVVSSVVVLDDQVSLINAKVDYYNSLYTYKTALAKLYLEVGHIFEMKELTGLE